MGTRHFALAALICGLALTAPTFAAKPLDVQIRDVRAPASTVTATIELRDVLQDRFRKLIDGGGVLHLRLQTELWQSRPTWDRLVYPAIVRVLRFARGQPGGAVVVTAPGGVVSTYATLPNPMPIVVDIGGADRLTTDERYYVHTIATLGTLGEREADDVSDALFGRENEAGTLGSLGRLVFRRVLQISDYLQSVSAETKSGRVSGKSIRNR